MNRRRFLTASGGVIATGTIGTLGFARFYGARTSSATDIVVSPGEEGTLSITWKGARAIGYRTLPDSEGVTIGIDDVELSPPPESTMLSYPPGYHWEEPTTVEMTIPVTVATDIDPGDYQLVLRGSGPADNLHDLLDKVTSQLLNNEHDYSYPSHTLTVTVTDS